jgi:flagellar FliL protein
MAANEKSDDSIASSTPLVPKKSGSPLVPIIAVVVLVPALCYAVMDFVIIPKIKGSMGVASAPSAPAAKSSTGGKKAEGTGDHTHEFGTMVVNIAGSGNSRYLRTNFVVSSSDPKIADIIKENNSALRDSALTVLSTLTLASLENANSRDLVRKSLIKKFNDILGAEEVDQIYFTEFVIQ